MSKYTKKAIKVSSVDKVADETAAINYMGARSFELLNPVETLQLVMASSIFGEKSYYESAELREGKVVAQINSALEHDFEGTLALAASLRDKYYMRLNPQIILVYAAMHSKRAEFTKNRPAMFEYYANRIVLRPDDVITGIEYYISLNGGSQKMPGILKRVYAKILGRFSNYSIYKYANRGIGLVDAVRIVHAYSDPIDQLMKGTLTVQEPVTWMQMRSSGKSWSEIVRSGIKLSHSDLLYQFRSILSDPDLSTKELKELSNTFVNGVNSGMIFPYKYWIAAKSLESSNIPAAKLTIGLDAMHLALNELIKSQKRLNGHVAALVDNSGSTRHARATIDKTSASVRDIGNLGGLIAALAGDSGEVGVFGDKLIMIPVSKYHNFIDTLNKIQTIGDAVGQGTENGIWLFWRDAIEKREHYDNVFIFSDMQAGAGQLYGKNEKDYKDYQTNGRYIDVYKLVEVYRNRVNPNVNVFSVQIGGYDNVVIPETMPRTYTLTGWTGKEVTYASAVNEVWDNAALSSNNQ